MQVMLFSVVWQHPHWGKCYLKACLLKQRCKGTLTQEINFSPTVIFACNTRVGPAEGGKEPHLPQLCFAVSFGTFFPPKHCHSPQLNPAVLQQHSAHDYQADKPPA